MIEPVPAEGLLSIDDLAARYQVSPATVHQWLYKRTGPRSLKIGRYRRFRLADVLEWEALQEDSRLPEPAA
jgi:predicted DNA-binding transcriptional regulator AlpA